MKTVNAFKCEEGRRCILGIYDSILDRFAVPERFHVETRYGKTFILSAGEQNRPPIILLHGSAMNSAMWLSDMQQYSREYRVFAVDIPGEPGRSSEAQLPFTGSSYSCWLEDVLNALSVDRACLVGLSLGAFLSAKFAIANPDRVSGLVLLAPAGIGSQNTSFLLSAFLHGLLGERGMKRLFRKVNGNQPIPEEMLEYQMLISRYFNFRREPIPLFTDAEIRRLSMPVLAIAGAEDPMFRSLETEKRLRSLLPHSDVRVIAGASHALVGLAGTISSFLSGISLR